MLHDFELAGRRMKLWQRPGESYEHVLMKALGFAMFAPEFPSLSIETKLEMRYTPDLIAINTDGDFDFWGECGQNSLHKTHWILKHTRTPNLVLFKIGLRPASFINQLRREVPEKYRPPRRLRLINFTSRIVALTESRQIAKVAEDWFSEHEI